MNKLDCGCNKSSDGIDTDIFKLFPKDVMKVLNKSIGLDTSDYNDTVKDKMKEVAKNKGLNLRTMLDQNPLISKHIIMIEKHKQGGVFKFQQGGSPLSQYPNTAGIYTSPRPAVEMQQGGQVNQMQQKFIKWLAGKLGAKSQQELQAKMQQLGQEGLKKAQEAFMQEQGGQAQEMQQGGVQEQYRTMQSGGNIKGRFNNGSYTVGDSSNQEYLKKAKYLDTNPTLKAKMTADANRELTTSEMDYDKERQNPTKMLAPRIDALNQKKKEIANKTGIQLHQQGGKTKGLFKTDRVDKKLMEESDGLDKSNMKYKMIRDYSLNDSYNKKDFNTTKEDVDKVKKLKSKVKSTFNKKGGILNFVK